MCLKIAKLRVAKISKILKSSNSWVHRALKTLYGVNKAPSDTTLRERLDTIQPSQLRRGFKQIFANLQRGKALEAFRYLDGHYIISIDGTGQYYSKNIHCDNCCEKNHRDGTKGYYHQMLVGSHRNEHPHLPTSSRKTNLHPLQLRTEFYQLIWEKLCQ